MLNYDDMSDFEIECRVQKILKCAWCDGDGNRKFYPCSNINHAWPIISEYGIDLISHVPVIDEHTATTSAGACYLGGDYIKYSDKNILRAVMIVFLKMKEKEVGNA